MDAITTRGTIDQLVADAAARGHRMTARTIRDWTELGLLDYPQRRPAGKGHGSSPALYSPNQRNMLATLLHHRATNGIRGLARIPVAIWVYSGEDYVTTSQALRAMRTWLGDPRVSRKVASQAARAVLEQLDSPHATPAARRRLVTVLTDIAWTGRADYPVLEHAVRDVFEPSADTGRAPAQGAPPPKLADSMIDLIKARLDGVARLTSGMVTEDELLQARHIHRVVYSDYRLSVLSAQPHVTHLSLTESVTLQSAIEDVGRHLLTVLGLSARNPERSAQIAAMPAPQFVFSTAAPTEGQ